MEWIVDYIGGAIGYGQKTLFFTNGNSFIVSEHCKIEPGAKLHPVSGLVGTYEGEEFTTATTDDLCERCGGCTLNDLYRAILGRLAIERINSESMVN